MSRRCERIQELLIEAGPRALREDAEGREHVTECTDCFAVLEAVVQLEKALAGLEVFDAPEEVVEQLLARARTEPAGFDPGATVSVASGGDSRRDRAGAWARRLAARELSSGAGRYRRWLTAAAVVVTGAVGWWLVSARYGTEAEPPRDLVVQEARFETAAEEEAPPAAAKIGELESVGYVAGEDNQRVGGTPPGLGEGAIRTESPAEISDRFADQTTETDRQLASPGPSARRDQSASSADGDLIADPTPVDSSPTYDDAAKLQRMSVGGKHSNAAPSRRRAAKEKKNEGRSIRLQDLPDVDPMLQGDSEERGGRIAAGTGSTSTFRGGSPRLESSEVGSVDPGSEEDERVRELIRRRVEERPRDDQPSSPEPGSLPPVADDARQAAQGFLQQRSQVAGVTRQKAAGYWTNAYVPGDPVYRLLQSRLLGGDRGALEGLATTRLALHDAARKAAQPFDLPANAAMAVYLHADRTEASAEGRVLLQVGLQATERRSGRRSALNLAVVLDLRGEISAADASAIRSLVTAINDSRDLGDRFHLLVAGRPGGLVTGPDEFRHGPVVVALDQALGLGGSTAPTLGLAETMALAVEHVREADDPNTPLGSSVVLLVTSQAFGSTLGPLEQLAHASAVGGVPVSVVGVGSAVDRGELDHIALAGQGNRRLLTSPADAPGLVDRELSAVSRVVARALRLRIRLAPGVELVKVLGSDRLDAAGAEAVREAELSLDLRLARNLGIEADRGEDEEGIQIVIPSFYAGDSHVVLLDLTVPGPGPVADVTVRYKDLVYLRNGVARDHFSLGRGEGEPGPLELSVLKNLLAFRLFEALEQAGRSLAAGQSEAARETLHEFLLLLQGLRQEMTGLAHDADLASDIAMLEEYLSLLGAGVEGEAAARSQLVDSMRFAGRLKILPQPLIER